jgi:hypothetical protein
MMLPLNSEAAETFIEVEVSTAELFTSLAVDARESEARERHLELARKAYDTARHFLPQTDLGKAKRTDFERRLGAVQLKLESLGEV